MERLINNYTEFLRSTCNLAESTVGSYKRDIMTFAENIDCPLDKVTCDILSEYIENMKTAGKSDATVLRTIASLRSFYRYLESVGMTVDNPTLGYELPKLEKKLPQILTVAEVEKLLSEPDCDAKGLRDKAMLEVLYATGIKVSELVGLKISNINMRRRFLICTSGYKARTIPLGKMAINSLNDYLKRSRPALVRDRNETALFVSYNGTAMSRQGFWKMIKKYAKSAGITSAITPHTLRHSFAMHLLENGADLASIQEMMGLENISSTNVYTRIIENKIANVYNKAHPRA